MMGLGLVADGPRKIKPIPADLLALVPKPKNIRREIKESDTDPERDTVPLMKKKIRRCVSQVAKLAPKLKGSTVLDTVRNDWNFVFDHIQYVPDPERIEAVRDACVTIHDRKGDCDCFSVLIGSLLLAQRIPFKIRIAAYEQKGEWGHVYIVVIDKGKEIIVDPVVHKFNYEAPYIDKKDFDMKLVSLEGLNRNGVGSCVPLDSESDLIRYIDTPQVYQWGQIPTQQFLEQNNIPYHQSSNGESTQFVVSSPGGELSIPTIISPELAEKIKGIMSMAKDKAEQVASDLNKKFGWWIWVVGGIALYMLLKGDKKKESAATAMNGISGGKLGGLAGKKKTKKRQAKKLATLQL